MVVFLWASHLHNLTFLGMKDYKSTPEWARIDEIMWHYRFRTTAEFARHLGLKRTENLYQIKRGNNRISFALADAICEKFPQINKGWLLCGDGEMMKQPDHDPTTRT